MLMCGVIVCIYNIMYTCRKSLLSEGLSFLVKAFNLFPPIDKARFGLTKYRYLRFAFSFQLVHGYLVNFVVELRQQFSTREQRRWKLCVLLWMS